MAFSIDEENVTSALGIAGARYLDEIVEKGDILGVTWGKMLSEVTMQLPVVQLVGGMHIAYTALRPDEITRQLQINSMVLLIYYILQQA